MRSAGTGVSEPVCQITGLQPRLGFLMVIFLGLAAEPVSGRPIPV